MVIDNPSNIRLVRIANHILGECSGNGIIQYLNTKGEEVNLADLSPEPLDPNPPSSIENPYEKIENLDIIAELSAYLRQYIYFENYEEYTVLSLTILLSHSTNLFERIPYLWLNGGKGVGKTTIMSVIKPLVYSPIFASNITTASLFRIVDMYNPTLFLDEVEGLKARNLSNNPFVQVLNSGYQRDGTAMRAEKTGVKECSTFCLKILAGINPLFDTLMDRCIRIQLTKPPNKKNIRPYSSIDDTEIKRLRPLLHTCLLHKSSDRMSIIKDPGILQISPEISFRELDKWMPMLALAKVFSGERDYFSAVQEYALKTIAELRKEEQTSPENTCQAILQEFLADKSADAIYNDKHFFYFGTDEIQKLVLSTDQANTYRNKADITLTLKKIGVETDRRRFGSGPVSLYKIPKSFLNQK